MLKLRHNSLLLLLLLAVEPAMASAFWPPDFRWN